MSSFSVFLGQLCQIGAEENFAAVRRAIRKKSVFNLKPEEFQVASVFNSS